MLKVVAFLPYPSVNALKLCLIRYLQFQYNINNFKVCCIQLEIHVEIQRRISRSFPFRVRNLRRHSMYVDRGEG